MRETTEQATRETKDMQRKRRLCM